MHTKESLIPDLKQLDINVEGTLLVHSSYKSIGAVKGGPDAVLDTLSAYMKAGLLVLPTHTWEYINKENPVFDVRRSPSNVGILTERFRRRPNVFRSEHPTHSVAALGKEAESFTKEEYRHDTPCARQSVWGKLVDRDAKILLIGVDLTRNTFIHGIEEWVDTPGRMTESYEDLYSVLRTGEKVRVPSRRHSGSHASEHYWKVEEILLEEGAMSRGTFGDADVRVVDARKTADLLTELLLKNSDLFSDNEPLADEWRYYFQNKHSKS
ncbi:aminoglycoside 3-N-acetyltransferase [Alkalibacterium subtropicum]|uniref:Aminoglycoside N(3)-acetyltransferase n=1 Tax=Alkalibacterium subtropicum TaxID=753702 RepID=A0A1I1FH49_9LACT|nr:AAC(3) family N-acetyltransferase [Alkalibacterium subtropicum]SFB98312.1 aminoglycoside 3-N-acetyltransferase [Alkalibacterium subtropicum]